MQRNGRTAVATANGYDPQLPQRFRQAGAFVERVETMTLEEIFIASVPDGGLRR